MEQSSSEKRQKTVASKKRGHRLFTLLRGMTFGVYRHSTIYPPRKMVSIAQWERPLGFLQRKGIRKVSVDPAQQLTFPPQRFLAPTPSFEERVWKKNTIQIPEVFIYSLPLARTIGARGAIVTNDNVILQDISMVYGKDPHPLLIEPQSMPKHLQRLEGTYALISGPGNSTYHWLFDIIPRVELLRKAGYNLDDFDGFIMRQPKYLAHFETLELLGIPENKITWCTKTSHLGCDRLVVPSPTSCDDYHAPWIIPFLKQFPGIPPHAGKRRRIIISRKDAPTGIRRIVNQDEVSTLLQQYGFEEMILGDLSFKEQATLFASAEFIVTPHGGGIANICFCEPTTKLIELFAPDYVPGCFRAIARQIGMDYEPLLTDRVPSPYERRNGGDMRVNLEQLKEIVETMLARDSRITSFATK